MRYEVYFYRFGPAQLAAVGTLMKKKEYKQTLSRFWEPVFGDFGKFWMGFLYKWARSACILAFACIPAVPLHVQANNNNTACLVCVDWEPCAKDQDCGNGDRCDSGVFGFFIGG